MKFWSWYAHAWYFNPEWRMYDEIETGFDLRRWLFGISFGGKLYTVEIGPVFFSYRSGL